MDPSIESLITFSEPAVTEAARLENLQPNAGVPDGTVWTDVHGEQVKVVYEFDSANQVTGWHVEPIGRTV